MLRYYPYCFNHEKETIEYYGFGSCDVNYGKVISYSNGIFNGRYINVRGIGISGMFCGVFIKSYYYGTTEIVLIQKEVAMLGWILCIYGIIFMIFIIFSTRRLWKEISKIWGDKN